MYERKHQRLAPLGVFIQRMLSSLGIALGMIATALSIGLAGYHWIAGFNWVDSLLEASMILGGMGPVDPLHTVAGKIFASLYALFSGIVFLVSVAVLMAPLLHRMLHQIHVETTKND